MRVVTQLLLLFVVSIVAWTQACCSSTTIDNILYLPIVDNDWIQSRLAIDDISDNRGIYPESTIPRYSKLEITFQVRNSVAQNLQFPYDPAPPVGIDSSYTGISVDAIFTPDNWQTSFSQPAFYYQEFVDEQKGNRDWFYPTDDYSWKVRFSPHLAGDWQFKLRARDASGIVETNPIAFKVSPSSSPGFLKVSPDDSRYFEFDDGTYFPGLGYNMNYNHVSWVNPRSGNQANFQVMGQNGIQLVRIWLSQWAIFGSAWNPWHAQDPFLHGSLYIPHHGLSFEEIYPGSETSREIRRSSSQWDSACMVLGMFQAPPAVNRNADYLVRVRYKLTEVEGPLVAGKGYGFTVKTGGWLWGDSEDQRCYSTGTGKLLTPSDGYTQHVNAVTGSWEIWEGTLNTGNADFLPRLFLTMENSVSGAVYIDYVWIQEILPGGELGPNIVAKPDMDHHRYFEQRNSYAFDKVIELAEASGVYLRPVILEKNEWLQSRFNDEGGTTRQFCTEEERDTLPAGECPNNAWFYGNGRQLTKTRWLQQAWWRYLQARWGYSTSIHSWELLNEGNPFYLRHYMLADEFGKYMHCQVFDVAVGDLDGDGSPAGDACSAIFDHPNDHMVSTSNWHSFPLVNFWANEDYPNVDFADVHRYIRDPQFDGEGDAYFYDAALATNVASMEWGGSTSGGPGKPVIRGETGLVDDGSGPASAQLLSDTEGIWLHNFIWGQINSGGLIESYWYENRHIYTNEFDHRPRFKPYYDFIMTIPLSNGNYEEAGASVNNPALRVWGQKDLVNDRAHLWIQNVNHTWKNVVDGVNITPASAVLTVSGFSPNTVLAVEWWDTYAGVPLGSELITTDASGSLSLSVNELTTDIAVRIKNRT